MRKYRKAKDFDRLKPGLWNRLRRFVGGVRCGSRALCPDLAKENKTFGEITALDIVRPRDCIYITRGVWVLDPEAVASLYLRGRRDFIVNCDDGPNFEQPRGMRNLNGMGWCAGCTQWDRLSYPGNICGRCHRDDMEERI